MCDDELFERDKRIKERFILRDIQISETEDAVRIEHICFPPNEACKREHMSMRIQRAPEQFLVAYDKENDKIAGFLNGVVTEEADFRDEFFTDISLHDKNGCNVMLLGLDVLPEYRKQGLARTIVEEYCRREKERGRKRLVLTCLTDRVKMYEHLGFRRLGISGSSWGGESWHEMDFTI